LARASAPGRGVRFPTGGGGYPRSHRGPLDTALGPARGTAHEAAPGQARARGAGRLARSLCSSAIHRLKLGEIRGELKIQPRPSRDHEEAVKTGASRRPSRFSATTLSHRQSVLPPAGNVKGWWPAPV